MDIVGRRGRRPRIWKDQQLIDTIPKSASWNDLAKKLGMKSPSNAYRTLPYHITRLGLDVSHFRGRRVSGNRAGFREGQYSLEEILVKNSSYTSSVRLKNKLIKARLLKWECYECGLKDWCGKSIKLQLDHINGVRNDNRILNLRILCPNCHSMTSTYAGKNAGSYCYG